MNSQSRSHQRVPSSGSSARLPSLAHQISKPQPATSSPALSRKDTPGARSDTSEMSQNNSASTPMRVASRLRQEISHDAGFESLSTTASPQTATPSRLTHVSDSIEILNDSPAPSQLSHHDMDNPPMPLPRRRAPLIHRIPSYRIAAPATSVKRDSRPKQYSIETPSDAPRYVTANKSDPVFRDPFSRSLFSGNADFFPWNGNHHEDEWSAEAIQKGTWDRGSQNETSSARFAVMPALKQKTGLSALSTIFMGVLNQRRNSGQITAPSTFKPPPRVTVTDTKREVWLKDLANPAISLRRLSRTIPHGIRGKTLLDQCLNKNVPTERAIWLAKCVGANDIRALNRKGVNGAFAMGGELKWIRDWTVFVEQFVESVVSGFTEPDWKQRVIYATRLATVLYAEHLLDRDHYLDWITASLEASPQSKIPMWIIIAQICWKDLLRSRKHGRRLVFGMLSHLHSIYQDPDRDLVIQLSSQLSTLLSSLIKSHPENFLYPALWSKYRESLRTAIGYENTDLQASFNAVDTRNRQLVFAGTTSSPSGYQHLVRLLDSTLTGPAEPNFAVNCWASLDDKTRIVKTVIEWATSSHRPGVSKIYTAANLLREWSTQRINPTSSILELLDGIPTTDTVRKQLLYHLVAELCRSGHFSLPQYIQWLIARGSCRDSADIDPVSGPCASRLLVELPMYCFSEEGNQNRANLLRRAGNYDVMEEAQDIATAKRYLREAIGLPVLDDDDANRVHKPIPLRKLLNKIKNSSMALKCDVGAELRTDISNMHNSTMDPMLSLNMFISLRSVFEATTDFAMLADVLKACTRSSSIDVLAACADTVNVHLTTFLALNQAEELFDGLLTRLKVFARDQGVNVRPFLASLALLAAKLPDKDAVVGNLQQELAHSDKNSAIDACSPVSDNMVGQSADGEVSEQIDRLLASGTSVDVPTMNRLFRNIFPRLESGWAKVDDSRRVFASLLSRLRVFDAQHFDKLMADWVSHIRLLPERQPLHELFPLLLSLGCLTVSTMLQTASPAQLQGTDATKGSASYLQEVLQLMTGKLPKDTPLTPDELYRFQSIQTSGAVEHSKLFLQVIRNTLMEYSALRSQDASIARPLDENANMNNLLAVLRLLVIVDAGTVSEALKISDMPSDASAFIRQIVGRLLNPQGDANVPPSFDQILSQANELTMPFCQLTLNMELSFGQLTETDGDQGKQSQFDIFARAMDSAIDAKNIMWTSMLPCLNEDITQHLKSQAYYRFFDLVPSSKSEDFTTALLNQDRIQLATNLLGVIEAIISGQPSSKSGQLTSAIVDKLADVWETLASPDTDTEAPSTHTLLKSWLPVLLRFISFHGGVPELTAVTTIPGTGPGIRPSLNINLEARARTILLLCGIIFELEARYTESSGSLVQQIFDIALLLVDALPDDLRTHCAKAIIAAPMPTPSKSATSDRRMYYLFSVQPATLADNLMLAHRDKASLPHSAAARGLGAMYGIGPTTQERFTPFILRRWEVLSEPTPNVGENDTSLSLGLFEAIKIQ